MINVPFYRFSELSDEAKEKAISNHRDINAECDWWYDEGLLEPYKEIGLSASMKELEFDLDRGAYAYFRDTNVEDSKKFLETVLGKPLLGLLKLSDKARDLIKEVGEIEFSSHKFRDGIDIFVDQNEWVEFLQSEHKVDINEKIETTLRDLEKKSIKFLRDSYDYMMSDECVADTLENSNYLFNAEGTKTL